jgi:Zn-dependent M28 family amino/carboxypeptidase
MTVHRSLGGLLVLAAACATTPAPPAPADRGPLESFAPGATRAAASIRPEALAGHIKFLADDLLEGRDTGSRGHLVAARYVAAELMALGLKPAGDDGTFFQKVTLIGGKAPAQPTLEITGGKSSPLRLVAGKDFAASADLGKGVSNVEAPLVFAGYAQSVPEYHYDDFAGIDLRGKIAVVFSGAPRSDRPDFFPSLPSAVHGQSDRVLETLRGRGAIGVLVVWQPLREALTPFRLMVQHLSFEAMRLSDESPKLPGALISTAAFDTLLREAGRTETAADLIASLDRGTPRSFDLGLRARFRAENPLRQVTSVNVVGLLPGDPSSPTRDEVIIYGAHLDHMGIGQPVNGDSIYNGASDDAAGVASLLETARAFTLLDKPPARSILFLFVTAEERGLLGSQWYAAHPTVPMSKIVADIDVDGAYPIHPLKDVVAIGVDQSSLAADVDRAAKALGLQVSPDPQPDEAYFVRSDNYSFVKQGVPAAQTLSGLAGLTPEQKKAWSEFWAKRYHQPQDEFEPDRDWKPFADLTRFNFLLGVSVAQRPARPTWNADSWFRRFPEPKASATSAK